VYRCTRVYTKEIQTNRGTIVVQGYMFIGVMQGHTCIGVVQEYRETGVVQV